MRRTLLMAIFVLVLLDAFTKILAYTFLPLDQEIGLGRPCSLVLTINESGFGLRYRELFGENPEKSILLRHTIGPYLLIGCILLVNPFRWRLWKKVVVVQLAY